MKEGELDDIDRYLLNRMDAEEHRAFKEKLSADKDLLQDVEIRKSVHLHLNEEYHRELKDKLSIYDKKLDQQKWLKPLIRMAAVSLILIVGVYSTYRYYNQTDLSTYDFYEEGINNYMNNASEKVEFNNAMSHFRSEDYMSAISEFKELLLSKPDNDTINYYLGVSYYRNEMFDKSIHSIQSVINNTSSVYFQKAEFRLGLAYLRDNDKTKARIILEKIAGNKKHPFYSEAKELMDSL